MRWVKAVTAALAILVVIAGAPVLLLGWGSLKEGWWRADDGSLFFTLLTVAGWLAWLAFTLATVLEVVRYAGGHRFVPDLPLLGGLQALCAGLVLAVMSVAGWQAASAMPEPVHPDIQPPQPTTVAMVDSGAAGRTAEPLAQAPEMDAETSEGYQVATGDDLWSVAERLLGDGRCWRELARANPELLGDPTSQLTVGSRLKLPTDAAQASRPGFNERTQLPTEPSAELPLTQEEAVSAGPALPPESAALPEAPVADPVLPDSPDSDRGAAPQPRKVTVERGDTLSGLAKEYLGSTGRWPKIAAANPGLINDPDHIEVGWKLVIPGSPTVKAEPEVLHRDQADPGSPGEPEEASPAADSATAAEVAEGYRSGQGGEALPDHEPTSVADGAPSAQVDAPRAGFDHTLIGGLSALAAAGLMGGWQSRRLLQSRVRQPGRRVMQPDAELTRLHAAIGRRQQPDHTGVLDVALRAIGQHHHRTGRPLPELERVTLTTTRISFQWATRAGLPPERFGGGETDWWVDLPADGSNPLASTGHPCAFPALVSLGTTAEGETVLVDLERSGVIGVAADQQEMQLASLAAIAVELACAPWAVELALVSVGTEGGLARAAGGDTVTWLPDLSEALSDLRHHHAQRARELAGLELRRLRVDPERADAVAPRVYVFHDPLADAQRQEIDDLLAGTRLGIAAVVLAETAAGAQWELFGDPLHPGGRFPATPSLGLDAHAIPLSTRAAVASWYQVAEAVETEPAPWWSQEDSSNLRLLPSRHTPSEESVDIVSLRRLVRPHPTLALIGPIDLTGAAGPDPSRSRHQLIELCCWLLENPGRTATEMAIGLGIAETTRRSNLSRLRSWLGTDPDGERYLPDAYSGRIRLHPQVSSDIAQLRLLTAPGVNRIGEDGLVGALDLIRGAMLADAAPGQWFWAEELRSDVSATLRDAGLVLVDRALRRGDLDLARWAVERALMVAPEDELLMCARIRIEHAAGNRAAVERHVLRLTQQARTLGVDLMPQTVMLCQQVMEGRPRARRA